MDTGTLLLELLDIQKRKSVGLITEQMLDEFVRLIDVTEKRLKGLGSSEETKFTLYATLAPKIRRENYDNFATWATPVGYHGP